MDNSVPAPEPRFDGSDDGMQYSEVEEWQGFGPAADDFESPSELSVQVSPPQLEKLSKGVHCWFFIILRY
jgi:hypothetical protein